MFLSSYNSKCIFFIDKTFICNTLNDLSLMIILPSDMVHLLSIAEQHSKELGYRWHPGKCAIIKPPQDITINLQHQRPSNFTLYNTPLTEVSTFQYLGIPFNYKGIDIDMLISQCISKAISNMALLRQLGIHQYGVGLWPAYMPIELLSVLYLSMD